MRLDKFLADAGVGTRSEVKKKIRAKLVKVDGTLAADPGMAVDAAANEITVAGQRVELEGIVWYLLNKPAGYVTAVTDDRFPTVMELVPAGKDLFPVGRLDKDTEGLLLITNDGVTAHRMLSPKHHVPKTYLAKLDAPAELADIEKFKQGLNIGDDKLTLPAELIIPDDEASKAENIALLTITEGRYHQVKRMFEAVGKKVIYLKRLSFGEYTLPEDLPLGQWIKL